MTENTILQEQPQSVQVEDAVMEVPVYPEPETASSSRRKKGKFWKVLSIYFALLMVCITLAVWFFYNHLKAYEAQTPSAALNNYLQWIQDGDYEAIYAASDFEETILNTKDEFLKYLERLYDGDISTLSAREKITSTEERKDYTIYMDEKRVSNLTLIKNPKWGETAWDYITEVQYLPSVSVFVSDSTQISINGVDSALLNLPNKPAQETVWSSMSATDELPIVYQYTLENLLNPPTIKALTLGGDVCEVVQTSDYVYEIYRPIAEVSRTEQEQLAQDTAFLYAEFVARDAEKNELLKLIHKKSDLYKTINRFDNQWFTGHSSYKFSDVKISGYSQYTASDFACEVSFQPIYYSGGKEVLGTPFHCRVMFIQVEDEWKLVELINITEDASNTTSDTTDPTTTVS